MIQIFGMEEPDEQAQLAAVTENSRAIKYIKNPSERVKRCAKDSDVFWKEEKARLEKIQQEKVRLEKIAQEKAQQLVKEEKAKRFEVSKAQLKQTANFLDANNEKELQEYIAYQLKNLFPSAKIVMEYVLTHQDYRGSQRADIAIFKNDLPFVIIEVKQGLQFDKKYAKSDATKQLKNYLHLSNAVFGVVLSQGYCEMWQYSNEDQDFEEIDTIDWSVENNMEVIDRVAKAKQEQSKVEANLKTAQEKQEKIEREAKLKQERLEREIADLKRQKQEAHQSHRESYQEAQNRKAELDREEREEKQRIALEANQYGASVGFFVFIGIYFLSGSQAFWWALAGGVVAFFWLRNYIIENS